MICFPNAKINIGLYVTEKRKDGYHNLETIFMPIALKDALEFIPTKNQPMMKTIGLPIDGATSNNLVWKAYELLLKDFPNKIPALEIILHKVIPMGAGLGGGSSDAAQLLIMLNKYCDLQLSKEQLTNYAISLGSDCPFFIYNKPQLAYGRGEELQDVELPNLAAYSLVLYLPHLHVSTADAFRDINPKQPDFNLKNIGNLPVAEWQYHIHNDFETTVMKKHPSLQTLKNAIVASGAVYTSMSGTGAAIYAIVPKGQKEIAKCDAINFDTFFVETI